MTLAIELDTRYLRINTFEMVLEEAPTASPSGRLFEVIRKDSRLGLTGFEIYAFGRLLLVGWGKVEMTHEEALEWARGDFRV